MHAVQRESEVSEDTASQGFVFPAIVPAGDAEEVPGLVSNC